MNGCKNNIALLTKSLGAQQSPASGFAVDLMKLAHISNDGG